VLKSDTKGQTEYMDTPWLKGGMKDLKCKYFFHKYLQFVFLGVFTRYRSAKSNKSNGINWILKENETAQMACDITNDSSTYADKDDGDNEARVSIGNSCISIIMYNSVMQ
jgi:hypothetical protein